MSRPLRIQYPNAPPASPERLAMAGRVVSRYEQGEKGSVYFPTKGKIGDKGYQIKRRFHMTKEITAQELNTDRFINDKVKEIRGAVGDGIAINALSGGVDSSTVTMLGHRAMGKHLKTIFIENGLMREGEPEQVVGFFRDLDVTVEVVDARKEFFAALKGITDPEEKR